MMVQVYQEVVVWSVDGHGARGTFVSDDQGQEPQPDQSRSHSRFPLCKSLALLGSLTSLLLLLLSCAKSHMLSASRRQPHLLHVSAVDRRQTWSMDKS